MRLIDIIDKNWFWWPLVKLKPKATEKITLKHVFQYTFCYFALAFAIAVILFLLVIIPITLILLDSNQGATFSVLILLGLEIFFGLIFIMFPMLFINYLFVMRAWNSNHWLEE
ncbi:MAG: hypothetical protein WCJ58_01260 [bacterium]